MVISLIMLSGGELSEQRLRRYLTRLNADHNAVKDKTDNVLAKMQKQNYIIRKAEKLAGNDEEQVSWLVGPRGKEEVGLDGVAGMVREVYGGSTPALEKKISASLGISEKDGEAEENGVEIEEGAENRNSGNNSRRRRTRGDDDNE
jgi:melanoma-associated antigen